MQVDPRLADVSVHLQQHGKRLELLQQVTQVRPEVPERLLLCRCLNPALSKHHDV